MKPLAIRLARGTFTIRLWPTLIALVMMAVMIGLGYWQIQRLHWKENLIAEMQERMQEPSIDLDLSSIAAEDMPNMEYRPARATGLLQNTHELFLTSISKKGEGGYHVLTPMQLDDGRMLLIDRGWVPYTGKDPATRDKSQFAKPVTISGILRLAHKSHWPQPDNKPEKGEWYRYDIEAMAQAAGAAALLPYVLEADDTPNPDRWPIGGQTRIDLPNDHFGYALTWFGLAFVLLVIYGVFSWQKPVKTATKDSAVKTEAVPESD